MPRDTTYTPAKVAPLKKPSSRTKTYLTNTSFITDAQRESPAEMIRAGDQIASPGVYARVLMYRCLRDKMPHSPMAINRMLRLPFRIKLPRSNQETKEARMSRAMTVRKLGLSVVFLAGCTNPAPSVREGRTLYQTNGCASCHGRDGRGDGPQAATVPSRPIDLHDRSEYKRGLSEDAIAKTLADGIRIGQSTPQLHHTNHDLVMPKFDHLTEIERRSLALYVISLLAGTDQGKVQP
jgi:mono/diheme cytochrome c family protein